jgi:hypothetical protein
MRPIRRYRELIDFRVFAARWEAIERWRTSIGGDHVRIRTVKSVDAKADLSRIDFVAIKAEALGSFVVPN